MKPIIDLEGYQKSIYRMFGIFPVYLTVLSCIAVYLVRLVEAYIKTKEMANPLDPEILSGAFLWGIIIGVGIYYISRFSAIRVANKAIRLTELEEKGIFIPCMDHSTWIRMAYGNLIITNERVYFQPEKQLNMTLDFDYSERKHLKISLSAPLASFGLFLVTGQKHMLIVKNREDHVVGRFILPEVALHLKTIETYW